MQHKHNNCRHSLKACNTCANVYCKKCNSEWIYLATYTFTATDSTTTTATANLHNHE